MTAGNRPCRASCHRPARFIRWARAIFVLPRPATGSRCGRPEAAVTVPVSDPAGAGWLHAGLT
jgi:hypothetical protein